MPAWIASAFWLACWIGIAWWARKSRGSWVISLGGGFLAACFALVAVVMLWSGVETVLGLNPNPQVKDWKITEPAPADDFWSKGKSDPSTKFAPRDAAPAWRALSNSVIVTSQEYGSRWSFTVASGELECIMNAVVMHTNRGTYSLNGKAMGMYAGKYPEWREIAKPYPGLEHDPVAKMPPPSDLILRGLALCGN